MNAKRANNANCKLLIVHCKLQIGRNRFAICNDQFAIHRFRLLMALIAAACLFFPSLKSASAQPRAVKEIAPAPPVARAARTARAAAADDAAEAMKDLAEKKFPGGAALKTDPEQQRLLKRAEQCVADGRLDLAAVLWQRVLDEAGDTLMTRDGRTYTSLADEVERTLSAGEERALATYRIGADGEAQAILAKAAPDKEEDALALIVRKYFLSSIGDDAAYKLACYALDRHDFVGASRLLTRILERHPDPSMPKSEILLRLAVASAHMGDSATASAALSAIGQIPGPRPESDVLDQVAQHLTLAAQSSVLASASSQDWPMALGNPTRTGRMKSLPAEATSRTLTELWVQEQEMQVSQSSTPNQYGMMGGPAFIGGRARAQRQQQNRAQAVSHDDLVEQWREHKWTPSGMLLFDGGRVYFKTHENLRCYSASATTDKPVWWSLWNNRYSLDSMSSQVEMMVRTYGHQFQLASDKPRGLAEVHLFGDRVHQQMSIAGGMIYSIEGERISTASEVKPEAQRPFQWGVQPRRTRSNFLAAYETRSGKVRWHRSASDEDKEGSQDVGFLCAPVPFSNLLLTAVTDGGTIWLYGLNAADGTTAWKSYLCDEPANGCKPWSPVGLAVDGREAYVVCGTGAVFAVDAVSGTIRWAVRYERAEKVSSSPQINMWYGQQQRKDLAGWEEDVVIPVGRTLLVMASDSDQILALDRRSGSQLWPAPRTPSGMQEASYCLGVSGRGLIVAGKNVVRRWDIPSGKLIWDHELGDSLGRGCLTDDAIYVPVRDSIVKLDLEKGREQVQVGVALTTGDPVGNLYSDGEKLWVTGGGRVYAMTNLEHRLALLAEQINAGDGEAQLNRMRLYSKAGERELMLADLRGAYARFQKTLTADEAAGKFLAAVSELSLPQQDPATTLDLFIEHFVSIPSPPHLTSAAARRADILASALGVLRQKKSQALAGRILALSPLYDKEYLSNLASQAILATAKAPDDVALLQEAVASDQPLLQLVAAQPLARLAPADARQPLAKLLESKDDRVKLAAARSLAGLGERTTLSVFVALLKSEDARVRQSSHESLRALSGQQIAFASQAAEEERAKTVTQWEQWVSKEGDKAALKTPLPDLVIRLGRTLIASHVQSSVVELDANFLVRSTLKVESNPWGVWGLPNGNRLVAIYNRNKVVEYNEAGKEVWSKEGLPGPPFSVQRLESGNTLVACGSIGQILEISPDGTVTAMTGPWKRNANPVFARRLDNGHTLVALQNEHRVVELDKSKTVIFEVRDVNGVSSCSRLENGNTLIVQMYGNQVIEVDPKGKKTEWSPKFQLQNPTDAQRLESGHTLIADAMGLHEVDSAGNQVREYRHMNAISISSY